MTYAIQKQIDATYATVGGQLYEVPSTCPAEPLDDAKYSGGQIINASSDPQRASRYLITLIHRYSGEEKLIDLLIDAAGFTAVMQEIRKHISYEYELFEWIDTQEPF